MFTGVIKLAQIDDYIAPSQNCIQPKIMKKDQKLEKATITLNDCLACSGCITSAESILIEQMSVKKFVSLASAPQSQIYLIMSAQSLLSLAKYYQMPVGTFLNSMSQLFGAKFPAVKGIFDLSLATDICHQLIYQQFLEKRENKNLPVICSECPGWVCYAEKTLTEAVTQHMSEVKSPQQIMGRLIRKHYGPTCHIVSIMPCYDKKLQAIRFTIEQGLKQVDLTLATTELVQLLKDNNAEVIFREKSQEKIEFSFKCLPGIQRSPIQFLKDQTSNGYIDVILNRLKVADYQCQQIRNGDFLEYTFETEDKQTVKMAKCYGFRNIQKAVQGIKKGKCPYVYIEMMACPGGCYSGGGQVRYEGTKNKDVVLEIKETQLGFPVHEQDKSAGEMGAALEQEAVRTKYKPIEKSLTESVLNW